jgi:hypothetical protein
MATGPSSYTNVVNATLPNDIYSSCSEETINYMNGDVYQGNIKDNKRNGYGVMKWKDGDIYMGNWNDDNMNGEGKITYNRIFCLASYEGTFVNNMKHGYGVGIFVNGNTYEGNWTNDYNQGHGLLRYGDNITYEGTFDEYGNASGKGIIIYCDGSVYNGSVKLKKKNGLGTMTYHDGGKYEGTWENDTQHGYGIMTYNNNNRYEGFHTNGMRNGKGKMYYNKKNKDLLPMQNYPVHQASISVWTNDISGLKKIYMLKQGKWEKLSEEID